MLAWATGRGSGLGAESPDLSQPLKLCKKTPVLGLKGASLSLWSNSEAATSPHLCRSQLDPALAPFPLSYTSQKSAGKLDFYRAVSKLSH